MHKKLHGASANTANVGESAGSTPTPPANAAGPARSTSVVAGRCSSLVARVTAATAASDGGTRRVTRGTTVTSAIVAAVSPAIVRNSGDRRPSASGARKCASCALSMTTANPLTKPSMTGWGTMRMNLPAPTSPRNVCARPARTTHPGR